MSKKKPLMRNIGEFFGHIVKAVKTDPSKTKQVRHEVQEEETDEVILRRTTIEEIEFKDKAES